MKDLTIGEHRSDFVCCNGTFNETCVMKFAARRQISEDSSVVDDFARTLARNG